MPEKTEKDIFFESIPADGSAIGNTTLQKILGLAPEKYWKIRDELRTEGRIATGRGKGGSVYRISDIKEEPAKLKIKEETFKKEKDLYLPFKTYVERSFIRRYGTQKCICTITANRGKKAGAGIHACPDITIISVDRYQYIPGQFMSIITFELKHYNDFTIAGVYETAAHGRFATENYLCVYMPKNWENAPDLKNKIDAIGGECERFKIGFIIFTDPDDSNSYQIRIEPDRREPDPYFMDEFINRSFYPDEKKEIAILIK